MLINYWIPILCISIPFNDSTRVDFIQPGYFRVRIVFYLKNYFDSIVSLDFAPCSRHQTTASILATNKVPITTYIFANLL